MNVADYFFDASALVKRYKTEPGTAEVNGLIDSASSGDRIWVSMLTWVELTSAIMGAIRGGHLRELLTKVDKPSVNP